MSAQTREQLKQAFSNQQVATGGKFANLIDSFKVLQSAISDPDVDGNSITFIATIEQNVEGVITVTKKAVNFSGYQTVADMVNYQTVAGMSAYQTVAGMSGYQVQDLQQKGRVKVDETGSDVDTAVKHGKKHYPTVRLLDSDGGEVTPNSTVLEPFRVKHVDEDNLIITLNGQLNVIGAAYEYILD